MIRIRVFLYEELPSLAELSAFLGEQTANFLGSGRRGKALQETLLGYCVLKQMLPNVNLDAVRKTPKGRPFLAGSPELDFSMTHCEGLVACALDCGDAPRVGLDAERLGLQTPQSMERIAARWFTEKERGSFSEAPTEETFLSVWTAKEAASKWQGGGLGDFPTLETAERETKTYRLSNFVLSAVCNPGQALPAQPEFADPIA